MASLRTLAALPPGDRPAFARAWWMLLACRLRLRFPRLLGARSLVAGELGRAQAPGAGGPPQDHFLLLFDRAVQHHVLAMPCLPRALALARFLRSYGVESRLRLGMKKEDQELRGHAWVESGGRPLNDPGKLASSFIAFQSARREA